MRESFYITLPSNVKSFENNKISSYKTKLASKILLDGEWEVGVSSVKYTKSWFNVRKNCYMKLYESPPNDLDFTSAEKIIKGQTEVLNGNLYTVERFLVLEEGHYMNVDEMIDYINLKLKSNFKNKNVEFFYNRLNRHCTMQWSHKLNQKVFFSLDDTLSDLLGFSRDFDQFVTHDTYSAKKSESGTNLTGGLHSMFIYTDIIEPSFVGDKIAPLIQTVGINSSSSFGDDYEVTYDNIHYHRLLTNEFETIEINIRDEVSSFIEFQFGRVIITFHLRKWKSTT
jgi:tRNA U38,U39,U40 pseudouridine synthase TruA